MKAALNLVFWEIYRKNRVVFPVLGLMLALGAGMALAASHAEPKSALQDAARTVVIFCFLISILIGFAPFILMESNGGWRMNSMITRWLALPLPTLWLAFAPLIAGCAFLTVLVTLWIAVLNMGAPGLDGIYLSAILCAVLIVFNAVAWTVPRRPLQFWLTLAVLFPVVLILSFGPQESRNEQFRRGFLVPLSYAVALTLVYTGFAARQLRSGAWPGELRLPSLLSLRIGSRTRKARVRDFRFRWTALSSLGLAPTLKILVLSWGALLAATYVYLSVLIHESHPEIAWTWRVLPMIGIGALPIFAIPWLAIWGMFSAGEPAAAFRTRLSGFRAALPISSGAFAADRILTLVLGWAVVWAPLVFFSYFYTPQVLGVDTQTLEVMQRFVARAMIISAFLMVGALPVYLWGRFEGFPNVLLSAVCVWALVWALSASLSVEPGEAPGWRAAVLGALLMLKFAAAAVGFILAVRQGHCTWRFPALTVTGWMAIGAFLVFVLPLGRTSDTWSVLAGILLLPLARLAWCPLAVAANRHR